LIQTVAGLRPERRVGEVRLEGGATRRAIAPVVLLAALSALAAGLTLAPPSAGAPTNTWSGTWQNSAPDGSFWVFTQSGGSVGGVWKGNASSGTLSGTIQGSTLTGMLVNNEAGQSANFSITLATDGHSFSGTFTVVGGSTGQWISACSGGACQSNAAPPPAPPPPGGGAPGQTSPTLLAAATAWGQVGPATPLAPGGEMVATSPRIGRSQHEATVAVSGDPTGLIDLMVAPVKQTAHNRARGECVVAAVLQVQDTNLDRRIANQASLSSTETLYEFTTFMIACLDYLDQLERHAPGAALSTAGGAARLSCKARPHPLRVQSDRVAQTISYHTDKASRRGPSRKLRISCRQAKDGKLTLRIRTRSRRTKLRNVLGPRLVAGAHRSTGATGTAAVQTTFKRR
jgi:hypothetical protein